MAVVYQPSTGEFRTGLFDCFGSPLDCALGYCFPDCYAFLVAVDAGQGILCGIANFVCYPFALCCVRGNVRAERNIKGSSMEDLLVTCCCPCCAAIQIRREYTGS